MTSIDALRQRQMAEAAAPMSEQSSIMMYRNPSVPVARPNMAELAREIEGTISPASETGPSDPEPEKESKNDPSKNKKKRWIERFPESLREPLLLLIVYLILSTETVKLQAAQYVSAINPGEDGKVAMSGVVLYGMILVAVYTGLKKLLL